MRTLSERVKRERVMWGMTQEDLAEATGIARDKIAKIETGRRDVDSDELAIFARTFQLTADELIQEPKPVVYHRIDLARADTQDATRWMEDCIDNSLFVRRVVSP